MTTSKVVRNIINGPSAYEINEAFINALSLGFKTCDEQMRDPASMRLYITDFTTVPALGEEHTDLLHYRIIGTTSMFDDVICEYDPSTNGQLKGYVIILKRRSVK